MKRADDATRSISLNQFGSNSRWFSISNFLYNVNLDDFSGKRISTTYI